MAPVAYLLGVGCVLLAVVLAIAYREADDIDLGEDETAPDTPPLIRRVSGANAEEDE